MNIETVSARLVEQMEKEVKGYQELLRCLNEETKQLKTFSAKELMESGNKKEMILVRIKEARKEAVAVFNELTALLHVDLPPLSISQLVPYLPARLSLSLRLLKNQLSFYHEEVMAKMNLNSSFINECLQCWNSIVNVLHPEVLVNYDERSRVTRQSFGVPGISVNREI